jgi:hypothetical protein
MTDDGLDQASTPAGFSYGYDDFASTQTGWLACCASPFMTLNQPDAMVDLKILGPKQPGGGKPKPPPPPPPPPGGKPAPPEGDDLITKVLMPIAEELNLPIAFKFGAMRGVNPSLRTVSDEATAPSAATATATATAMSCGLWAVGCGLCVCASSRRVNRRARTPWRWRTWAPSAACARTSRASSSWRRSSRARTSTRRRSSPTSSPTSTCTYRRLPQLPQLPACLRNDALTDMTTVRAALGGGLRVAARRL